MKVLLFVVMALYITTLSSQDKIFKATYSLQEQDRYKELINVLEPEFQKDLSKEKATKLADAFLYFRKYKKAISYYEFALNQGVLNEKEMINYFSALYEFGDFANAKDVANQFSVRFQKKDLLTKLSDYEELSNQSSLYVENFLSMNSKYNEYGFYPLFSDFKVINSDMPNMENGRTEKPENSKTVYIPHPYALSIQDTGSSTPQLYPMLKYDPYLDILTELNNEQYVKTITHCEPNQKLVYITSNSSNKLTLAPSKENPCTMKIFTARVDHHFKLTDFQEFKYNSKKYSAGQVSVSQDGQTLYFVSDMPGGFGGTDVYRCMKLEDGSWGAPINLGNVINTPGDEMFPYISPKGNTLYFSSTVHSVFGGLDINKSQKSRFNTFSKPVNLGAPINSNKDDFAFVFLDKDGQEGFFSSNRVDGIGGVDIYKFRYDKVDKSGEVNEDSNGTNKGIHVDEYVENKAK